MGKKLWSFVADFWRDGYALVGLIAAPLSIAFTVAKALDVEALTHLREVSYAWAIAPLLIWVFVAYVRRRSRSLPPTLKLTFGMGEPGCVSHDVVTFPPNKPQKQSTKTWYRVRVEVDGNSNMTGCRRRILSIKRRDRELLIGDAPIIPFTPEHGDDALSKDIRAGEHEFLDFLSASAGHGIMHVIKGHKSQKVDRAGMFRSPGEYYMTIAVSSKESEAAKITLKFNWSLDPATSRIVSVS
jgi:hypothetical protein